MSEEKAAQTPGANDGETGAPVTQIPEAGEGWKVERLKVGRQLKATEAELEKARAQLAEFENAKKTEQEKAIEAAAKAAREATIAEMQGTILQKDIRSEIRMKLAEAQVPLNQVSVVLEESNPGTVEEAVAAATAYAERWKTDYARPNAAGMTGGPLAAVAGGNRPWTVDKVNAFVMQHGHSELLKHMAEINADLNVA